MSEVSDPVIPARPSRFWPIDRRLLILGMATLAIGLAFWLGSRVPNLNEKAMMGGAARTGRDVRVA